MKFPIKDFFSKCDQIRRKLRIWSHLLKKFLMKNFTFCVVYKMQILSILKNFNAFQLMYYISMHFSLEHAVQNNPNVSSDTLCFSRSWKTVDIPCGKNVVFRNQSLKVNFGKVQGPWSKNTVLQFVFMTSP